MHTMFGMYHFGQCDKKASEYDQEMPQSHSADQRKSHRTLTVTRHQEDS